MEDKIIENNDFLENAVTDEALNQEVEKKIFSIEKKDILYLVLICLSAVLLSVLGIFSGLKAGFSAVAIILFLIFSLYLLPTKRKIKFFDVFLVFLYIGISLSFSITSNFSVRFWSFLLLLIISGINFYNLAFGRKESDFSFVSGALVSFLKGIFINIPMTFRALFSGENNGRKRLLRILLGIAMSVPVLIIIIPLLVSSDAAFSGLIENISINLGSIFGKILFSLIIAPFLISYAFTLKKDEIKPIEKKENKKIDDTILISFLATLSVCYIAYLFSQLAYFFSAFGGILPENYSFTLSDYARRGFFEMCIIAAINFILIFFAVVFSNQNDGKIPIITRLICLFIGFFTLIIISTALSKMVLYIMNFGMTERRITTSAFMLFLTVTVVAMVVKVFKPNIQILRVTIATAASVILILGIANVNHIIANYNYSAYKNNRLSKIDVNTIYNLGDEGVPYLVLLAKEDSKVSFEAQEKIKQILRDEKYFEGKLEYGKFKPTNRKNNSFDEFSFSRNKAYVSLEKYIKENPEICDIYSDFADYTIY